MQAISQRFICVTEPTETWTVWDESRNAPAELSGPLIGLAEAGAREACRLLNAIEPEFPVSPERGDQFNLS
jgi:hypothetical protein